VESVADVVRVAVLYDDEHRMGPNFLMSWPALFGVSVANGRALQWAAKLAKGYDLAQIRYGSRSQRQRYPRRIYRPPICPSPNP
jgi:hypothetical protein